MMAGRLDKRVAIRQASQTPDSTGDPAESWSTLVTVWAERVSQSPREIFKNDQRTYQDTVIWRVRYNSSITQYMRVQYASQDYRIEGIQEIGRKEGLLLITRLVV